MMAEIEKQCGELVMLGQREILNQEFPNISACDLERRMSEGAELFGMLSGLLTLKCDVYNVHKSKRGLAEWAKCVESDNFVADCVALFGSKHACFAQMSEPTALWLRSQINLLPATKVGTLWSIGTSHDETIASFKRENNLDETVESRGTHLRQKVSRLRHSILAAFRPLQWLERSRYLLSGAFHAQKPREAALLRFLTNTLAEKFDQYEYFCAKKGALIRKGWAIRDEDDAAWQMFESMYDVTTQVSSPRLQTDYYEEMCELWVSDQIAALASPSYRMAAWSWVRPDGDIDKPAGGLQAEIINDLRYRRDAANRILLCRIAREDCLRRHGPSFDHERLAGSSTRSVLATDMETQFDRDDPFLFALSVRGVKRKVPGNRNDRPLVDCAVAELKAISNDGLWLQEVQRQENAAWLRASIEKLKTQQLRDVARLLLEDDAISDAELGKKLGISTPTATKLRATVKRLIRRMGENGE